MLQKDGVRLKPRLTKSGDVLLLFRRADVQGRGGDELSAHEEALLQLHLAAVPRASRALALLHSADGEVRVVERPRDAKWWPERREQARAFARLYRKTRRASSDRGALERVLRAWETGKWSGNDSGYAGYDYVLDGDPSDPTAAPAPLGDGHLRARCLTTGARLVRQPPSLEEGAYRIIYRAEDAGRFNDVYAVYYSPRESIMDDVHS